MLCADAALRNAAGVLLRFCCFTGLLSAGFYQSLPGSSCLFACPWLTIRDPRLWMRGCPACMPFMQSCAYLQRR